jgi:hypothetical protein
LLKPTLRQLPYKSKPYIKYLGGGVNNGVSGFDIRDNEATEMENGQHGDSPAFRVRYPRTLTAEITGTGRHLGQKADDYLTVVEDKTWKYLDGSTLKTIGSLTGTGDACSVNFMGDVLLVNGTDKKVWNGSSLTDISDMPSGLLYLTVHANRVYGAKSTSLYFCALRDSDDWSTAGDAGQIQVETPDGDEVTGLVTYANHVIYFTENSMHELYGTGPHNYSFQTLSNSIGCVNNRTIKEVNGILYFLGRDGVYAYDGGTLPKIISEKVKKHIDEATFANACAGVYKDIYYLYTGSVVITFSKGIWNVEDDAGVVEFVNLNGVLYGLTADGITEMVDADGDEEVTATWVSKWFSFDNAGSTKFVRNIYVVCDIPTGGSIVVYITNDLKGSEYTEIGTIDASTKIQNQKIMLATNVMFDSDWYKIKLDMVGQCTVHAIEIQVRLKAPNY